MVVDSPIRIMEPMAENELPGFGRTYPIVIAAYDSSWPAKYEAEAGRIREALGSVALRIDHIGSTSVPGLGAKPVIDIQVSVAEIGLGQPYVDAIEGLGYEYRPDHADDDHDYFQREEDGVRAYQIHVVRAGSDWERRHLLFRDYLRSHPEEAARYEAVKRACAERHAMDILAYIDAKGEWIVPIERRLLEEVSGDRPVVG